jgi:hypothetical protein
MRIEKLPLFAAHQILAIAEDPSPNPNPFGYLHASDHP